MTYYSVMLQLYGMSYGLVILMMNSSNGLFFFKFSSKDRMDAMLENGPWFICNIPLILKKWTPNANLLEDDVCNVPVWVNFHDVPITAFSVDELSAIATKLAMIDLRIDLELKGAIVVAVSKLVGEGFSM
ncbi:hypothetical protein Tco_1041862 [Tanacetum coccineum]|uniref:DUF4283 domain-containing protein n=1 Tax=Tanacetum coccineum TaxID=301880 RepID=A0ABQ5GHC8_9ASTR